MKNPTENPFLTVLYVVCNERDLLPKSMASVEAVADEIIIVDTGSLDDTASIARRNPKAKVFSYKWSHDFSKVRNHGLQYAKGKWVLYIDSDEVVDIHELIKLREAMAAVGDNILGIALHIVDHPGGMGTSFPVNEKSFFVSPQIRAFRNLKEIRFEGKVAESVEASIEKLGGSVNVSPMKIHHYLWKGKGEEYKALKLAYYNRFGASFKYAPYETEQTKRLRELEPNVEPSITAIIICGYNALESTKKCLTSVFENTTSPFDLFFVDNGSTDGTSAYVQEKLGKPPIRFLKNEGVAKGRNAGIRAALSDPRTKYICFLDNDTIVQKGWLEKLINIIEQIPSIGLVGPCTRCATGIQNVSGSFPTQDDKTVSDLLSVSAPDYVFSEQIDRFCMLTKPSVIRTVGIFNETYGIYGCEEKDYCKKVQKAGLSIAVSNTCYIHHSGSATLKANKLNWNAVVVGAMQKYRTNHNEVLTTIIPSLKSSSGLLAEPSLARPKTSVVIIAYNRIDVTRKCLNSLATSGASFELIFVDNGSTDGTASEVKTRFPSAKIIKNAENLGIPKARNQGIKASSYPYIVLMDNDIVVSPGWLESLHSKMPEGKGGIVGIEAWKLGPDFAPISKCFSPGDAYSYLGGACCLFSRSVFEKAGLLDEGFSPAYFEDPDICLRAKEAGFPLIWHKCSKIAHEEHATLLHGQKQFDYRTVMSRSYERFKGIMTGTIKAENEKLPPLKKKLKILYLGMQYDYGVKERGSSFEHDNFYPSLASWDRTEEITYFDFAEIGKQKGIETMSSMLLDFFNSVKPNVLFSVFFDLNHDPKRDVVCKIGNSIPTIGWFCDSHFRYENFDKLWAPHLRFNTTTSTLANQWYIRDGLGNKVIKTQWAASPTYKRIDGIKKEPIVSFVGQPHGDRRQIIDQIKRAGIPVQVYGTGWGNRLGFQEMIMMFNKSLINLNLNNSCNQSHKQIKGRNFEVPACGGFLLTEATENLNDYYELGKEVDIYNSTEELIEKIKYYLSKPEEANAIADAGYRRTISEHTYAHRFEDIFKRAGLI